MYSMSSTGSVTNLVKGLKAGDSAAIDRLLERYRARVTGLARKRLRGAPRMVEDEDDIANRALWSLCKGARDGKFPRLNDRQDLWGLLVVITIRKATDQIAFWNAAKRRPPKATDQAVGDDDLIQRGPGPETLNILCEEYDRRQRFIEQQILDVTFPAESQWNQFQPFVAHGLANRHTCQKLTKLNAHGYLLCFSPNRTRTAERAE
jgi:DNA-directed RNA polymerase specialized sigma24 family protein